MSYPGLIADADHAQASGEKLLDQVVLFIVERCAAEVSQGGGLHQGFTVASLLKRAVAGLPDAIGNHIHRGFKFDFLPLTGVRGAILYFSQASRVSMKFEGVCALGTKMPTRDRGFGISFNRNQLAILMVGELPTTHAAVRTNGPGDFRA